MAPEEFLAFIHDGRTDHTTGEIAAVIGAINSMILSETRTFDPTKLNSALAAADPEEIASAVQVAILRGSFPFKEKLEAWGPFRERSRATLLRRGLNADRILRGL